VLHFFSLFFLFFLSFNLCFFSDRLRPANRIPHPRFPASITGCIDGTPIYIRAPADPEWRASSYSGKYKACVVKLQLICDHSGNILWYTGPHIGTTHDIRLLQTNVPPLRPMEKLLGDLGYVGYGPQVVVPFKRNPGQAELPAGQYPH
jgi:hypothetical protein